MHKVSTSNYTWTLVLQEVVDDFIFKLVNFHLVRGGFQTLVAQHAFEKTGVLDEDILATSHQFP